VNVTGGTGNKNLLLLACFFHTRSRIYLSVLGLCIKSRGFTYP
jgi:hypothetical protein